MPAPHSGTSQALEVCKKQTQVCHGCSRRITSANSAQGREDAKSSGTLANITTNIDEIGFGLLPERRPQCWLILLCGRLRELTSPPWGHSQAWTSLVLTQALAALRLHHSADCSVLPASLDHICPPTSLHLHLHCGSMVLRGSAF